MGKGSDAPNVIGGAEIDRDTARDSLYANRPTQVNPFGSITWDKNVTTDPATGELVTDWQQNYKLSPQTQTMFDDQMNFMQGRNELATGMLGRIGEEVGQPADWDQFGQVQGLEYDPQELRQRAEDAAYGRETQRLDPRFQKQGEQLEIKLRNQGLRPGDQAYDSAVESMGNERTDAYEMARMGAVGTGRAEADQLWQQQMGRTELSNSLRDKQIQEYIGKRGFSLDEANKLGADQSLADLVSTYSGGGGT